MELPRLQPLYDKYNDKGLQVIAVESYRDTERAKKFIEEKGLTYLCLENGEEDGEEEVATVVAVNVERLKDLDKDTLHSLHTEGWLPAIYAHLFSAENWTRLMYRHKQARASQ